MTIGRFGHSSHPPTDFRLEVDIIDAMAGEKGPVSDALIDRVARAMDFVVGVDEEALRAKERLRHIADRIRAEIGTQRLVSDPGCGRSAVVTAPNGARYHLSLDGDDLWIHAEPAPGHRVRFDFEAHAGNEGWLRLRQIVSPAPLPLVPRHSVGAAP